MEQDDLSDFDGDCAVGNNGNNGKGQEATLLASLLDGSLVAIGKASGKVTWSLADEPVSRWKPLIYRFSSGCIRDGCDS